MLPAAGYVNRIWCDASVDPDRGIAFGAYMAVGMLEPVVVKLKETRAFDAEVEIMTRALMKFPDGSIVMTDLRDLENGLRRWNYHTLARFKQLVSTKHAKVEYCPRDRRSKLYRLCHRAAIWRVRDHGKKSG